MVRIALFLFFIAVSFCDAGQIHAIVACDTKADGIERGVRMNLRRARRELRMIAENTGMLLNEIVLTGKKCVPDKLSAAFRSLKVQPDDVVFFFFSGHGFRASQKEPTPWPTLFFSSVQKGMELYDAAEVLGKKKARLTLVVAECCNSDFSEQSQTESISMQALNKSGQHTTRDYRSLFLNTSGSYVLAAASAGQNAWISNAYGGIFVNTFFDALQLRAASWERVFTATSHQVDALITKGLQKPMYKKMARVL